jgi:small-conductance mechanosensitive channel
MTDNAKTVRSLFVRAAIAVAVVIAAASAGRYWGQVTEEPITDGVVNPVEPHEGLIAAGALLVVLVAGVIAVRALSAWVRALVQEQAGEKPMAPLGVVVSFLGYLALVVCVLVVLERPVGGLLLGGALTGVLVGIAAQQVLANFFAGIVLLVVRPFRIADEIVLKSGPLGGEFEGLVTDMGLFYVRLQTKTGPAALPNAGVLASAIGPGVRAATHDDAEDTSVSEHDRAVKP